MKETLFFDNKKYFSSKSAGKISGYTNDYLSRLCRQKKVSGKKVGHTWYVEEDSLNSFVQNSNLQKLQLNKKLSNRRIRDYRTYVLKNEIYEKINFLGSKIMELSKTDYVKKGLALTLSLIIVFGGYFIKDTEIAKASYEKFSDAVASSSQVVAEFDAVAFTLDAKGFAKKNAVHIHDGINQTKPLVKNTAKKITALSYDDIKDISANVFTSTLRTIARTLNTTVNNLFTDIISPIVFDRCAPSQEIPLLVEEDAKQQLEYIRHLQIAYSSTKKNSCYLNILRVM